MPRTITTTKTETVTYYSFQELIEAENSREVTGQAVDRARNWLSEGQTDHDWWEYVYEMWKEALYQVGFEDADISFSGFWSQGDGASFTANPDKEKLVKFVTTDWGQSDFVGVSRNGKEEFRSWVCEKIDWKGKSSQFKKLADDRFDLDMSCKRNSSHYSHENTCSFYASLYSNPYDGNQSWRNEAAEALVVDFEKLVEELRTSLCHGLYSSLESEYEYMTGDEALADTADANDWLFDEEGRFHHASDLDLDAAEEVVPPMKKVEVSYMERVLTKRKLLRE